MKNKQKIIKTAQKLFSKYSYLGVSMNDIANQLKITKAALYYHFTGKTELYKNVLKKVYQEFKIKVIKKIKFKKDKEKLIAFIENYLRFVSKEKNLIKVVDLNVLPKNIKIIRYLKQIKNKIIIEATKVVKSLKLNNKINCKLMATIIISMMNGIVIENSFKKEKINFSKITEQISNIIFSEFSAKMEKNEKHS
jgi:hypothetical protein